MLLQTFYRAINHNILNDLFLELFITLGFLLVITKSLFPKRFSLNIKSPNIYIFEYEAQVGQRFSFYNLIHFVIKLAVFVIFFLALIHYYQFMAPINIQPKILISGLFKIFFVYSIIKSLIEIIFTFLIKKNKYLNKIMFIRLAYENYQVFYLYFLAFLIYFLPFHSLLFFYVIVTISTVWLFINLFNLYVSIRKHLDIKKYQIILYLCLSEILPFIVVIGWIIFQIL